jgi:hypothetical protein
MTNSFEATAWDEHNFVEIEGGVKLAHAKVSYKYTGHLEGESSSFGVLTYLPEGNGTYFGTELFTGKIDGKQGTVVLQQTGIFDAEHITGAWTIAPGTGSGELEGATGGGSFDMKMGTPTAEYIFV